MSSTNGTARYILSRCRDVEDRSDGPIVLGSKAALLLEARVSNTEDEWGLQKRTGMTVAMRFIATGKFDSNRLPQSARSCQ